MSDHLGCCSVIFTDQVRDVILSVASPLAIARLNASIQKHLAIFVFTLAHKVDRIPLHVYILGLCDYWNNCNCL